MTVALTDEMRKYLVALVGGDLERRRWLARSRPNVEMWKRMVALDEQILAVLSAERPGGQSVSG